MRTKHSKLFQTLLGSVLLVISTYLPAQIPQGIPNQSQPIDLSSTTEVILYTVLPVLMIIVYLIWRKKRNNKQY